MKNRRELLRVAAMAPLAVMIPQGKAAPPELPWLVVAHRGWNLNQREYSDIALGQMADGLKGLMIVSKQQEFSAPRIEDCHGVVAESRFQHGQVQVRVRWFSGLQLRDGFLTPTGVGTKFDLLENGYSRINTYVPWFLHFERGIAGFQGATRLP